VRLVRRLGAITVTALLIVHIVVSLAIAIANSADYRYVIITGGSMEPAIAVGDALILKEAPGEDAKVGDVVTFRSVDGALTTHRVLSLREVKGKSYLQTKGDANDDADPNFAYTGAVAGQPVVTISKGGYLASYLLSPVGRMVVFLPTLCLMLWVQLRQIRAHLAQRRQKLPGRRAAAPGLLARWPALLVVAMTLTVSLGAGVALERSRALFLASGSTTENTLSSTKITPPSDLTATVNGSAVDLAWTASPSPNVAGYEIWWAKSQDGNFTRLATVSGASTTTYTDTTPYGPTTYLVRAIVGNWLSEGSNMASVTAPSADHSTTAIEECTAQAPLSSGDGDGYEVDPSLGCATADAFASDANSGTNTSLSCSDTGKDAHVFHGYDLSAVSTGEPLLTNVRGIEVYVDGRKHLIEGTTLWCVQLSQDGGTTWSAPKFSRIEPTTKLQLQFGTETDLWGMTDWAPSSFGTANFRVKVVNVNDRSDQTFDMDAVSVKVAWTTL
jgi:signal peptidase I